MWFPSDATEPVVIDAALSGPRGLAAVGDVVYVAVAGKIVELPAGERHLRDVLSVSAYALRSRGETLYFHDGLSTISSSRLGDTAPQVLAEHVTVGSPFGFDLGARNDAAAHTTIHRASKSALATTDVLLGSVVGDVTGLQATPEGLYVAASPSLTDFDAKTLGFKRYGGPLLIIPRAMLDAR